MDQEIISKQLSEVAASGLNASGHTDDKGQYFLLVRQVETISKDWNSKKTDILFAVPNNYPIGGLDAFYADRGLILSNGQKHQRMQSEHIIIGKSWWLISWHYNKPWSAQDNLLTHIYHCKNFLKRGSRAN